MHWLSFSQELLDETCQGGIISGLFLFTRNYTILELVDVLSHWLSPLIIFNILIKKKMNLGQRGMYFEQSAKVKTT